MNNNLDYKIFTLNPIKTDEKPGELVDLDINKICLEKNLQFNISKCFYINELNSQLSRGNHSNYNASEILVCLKGSFEIKLHNGKNETIFKLKKNDAIFINKNIWIDFYNFEDCIIMAFVSVYIDNKQSCYDFKEFINSKSL